MRCRRLRPPRPARWSTGPRSASQELHADNRELHFSREAGTNRVVIEVRDLDGNVIKTIPPAKALDIMSGAEL